MGTAQQSPTPQPDSPATAQPSVRWIRRGTTVYTREGGLIASVYDGQNYDDGVAGEVKPDIIAADANTKMIVALPDLYAACSEVLQGLELTGAHGSHWATVLRAAIAKARGGVS